MTDFNMKKTLGTATLNFDLYCAGTYLEFADVVFDEATAGYTPAVGDVLCRKTDDTNKHAIYDETDKAALVLLGVVDKITEDNEATPNVIIRFTKVATCHYDALGTTGVDSAAKKLVLLDALRAINIDTDS